MASTFERCRDTWSSLAGGSTREQLEEHTKSGRFGSIQWGVRRTRTRTTSPPIRHLKPRPCLTETEATGKTSAAAEHQRR